MTTPAFAAGERIPLEGFAQIILHTQRPGIYALTDPTRGGCIAYVGQATSIARRYMEHVDPTSQMSDEKRAWTKALRSAGHIPGLLVLEWCDRQDLTVCENAWIKRAKTNGCGWLNGPITPYCGSPDGLAILLGEIGKVERARAALRQRQRQNKTDRAKVAARVYRAIIQVRDDARQAEVTRQAKQRKDRTAARLEESFERRVLEEVERRTAAQREQFIDLERKFRVRARNAAHLGLGSVEAP